MKLKTILLKLTLATALLTSASAQTTNQSFAERIRAAVVPPEVELPKFDLDFAGGTPAQLVDAIQARIGVLNAIVPSEYRNEQLPPLKMRDVTVKQLFEALEMASQKTSQVLDPSTGRHQYVTATVGFRANTPIRPETVWYFYAQRPHQTTQQKIVRYFQLTPYLAKLKVDDITTAIQAGWKMLGETDTPELNYHEDTKLLIAVGEISKLNIIDSVLQELGKGMPHYQPVGTFSAPPPVAPKTTGQSIAR
jgi:hypothetical protein